MVSTDNIIITAIKRNVNGKMRMMKPMECGDEKARAVPGTINVHLDRVPVLDCNLVASADE